MKATIFLFLASSLPFLGRFEEMRTFQNGKLISEHSTYSQESLAALMIAAAFVFLCAAWDESKKNRDGRKSRLIHFWPALLALPASWQNWSMSRFAIPSGYTEIKSGLGGPMTNLLLVAAAALFIALDAYWRQKEAA
jgi:hypothetical protein